VCSELLGPRPCGPPRAAPPKRIGTCAAPARPARPRNPVRAPPAGCPPAATLVRSGKRRLALAGWASRWVPCTSMRRLAKQSRNDRVLSARDYQAIQERRGTTIGLDAKASSRLACSTQVTRPNARVPFIGVGGYFRVDKVAPLEVTLGIGEVREAVTFECSTPWARFGRAVRFDRGGVARREITIPRGPSELHLWGLDCGALAVLDGSDLVRREEAGAHGADASLLGDDLGARLSIPSEHDGVIHAQLGEPADQPELGAPGLKAQRFRSGRRRITVSLSSLDSGAFPSWR